jgi:diacylglycerol kinase (ATP)
MTERVSVIVNPAAGRGRAARMLPRVTAAFAGVGVDEILLTRSRGHETDLARDAIDRGATTLVVVGTDNVDSITLARKAVEPGNTHVDVGKIEDHYFLNACGFGFDVAVLEGTLRRGWLRGNSVYLYAALTELFGYRGFDVRVSGETRRHMLIAIANTEFFGGMFRIAPGAQVSDGELDMERARSFQLSFPSPPTYETDGELHSAASADLTVSSCPAALRVVTAPGP